MTLVSAARKLGLVTSSTANDQVKPDSSDDAANPVRTDLQSNGEVTARPRTEADKSRVSVQSKIFDLISSGEWQITARTVELTAGKSVLVTFADESRLIISTAALASDAELEPELADAWTADDDSETS